MSVAMACHPSHAVRLTSPVLQAPCAVVGGLIVRRSYLVGRQDQDPIRRPTS